MRKEAISSQAILSFQKAKEKIAQDILNFSRGARLKHQESISRFEAPCPRVNCLDWLEAQAGQVKVYWANRDNSFQMAGIGAADIARGTIINDYRAPFNAVSRNLRANGSIRYYGGMDFYPPRANKDARDKKKAGHGWKAFGGYCFFLPRFEVVYRQKECFLACNLVIKDITGSLIKGYLNALRKISFSLAPTADFVPKIKSVSLSPDKEEWQKLFRKDIQPLGKMVYKKIVLAQKTSIKLVSKVDPLVVFKKLIHQAPGSFQYYFQVGESRAFFGASPERLLKRQGSAVESEALAGTGPRGKTARQDARFEKILRDSPKDALEHGIVVEAIKDAFRRLCVSWQADAKPSVAKAPGAHHLITYFRGTLKTPIDNARILSLLHPTPAVGGMPRNKAIKAIARLEPFERGWYAGPVGCIGYNSLDFAVALRCALIRGPRVNLYAGAGIVKGSSADAEWQEIGQKKSIFLNILESHKRLICKKPRI